MELFLIPVAFAVVATVAGMVRRNAARPDHLALVAVAVVGIGFAVLAATTHDPAVPPVEAVFGVLGAGVMLGAAPAYLYFALGRALAGRRIALGLVCAASTVPLAYYWIIGSLAVLGLVHCPADAYECPV